MFNIPVASIIITGLSIFINWALLVSLMQIASGFAGITVIYNRPVEVMTLVLGSGGMAGTLLLSLTPVGDFLLGFSHRLRSLDSGEAGKLIPLFSDVCFYAGVSPDDYKLYVQDNATPNAMALGKNMIIATTGFLATASDREIKGVLAHELGHLALGHTFWSTLVCASEVVGFTVISIYSLVANIAGAFCRIPIIGLVAMMINWPLAILIRLFTWLVSWPWSLLYYFGSRGDEYDADAFASQLGFGAGLRSFLEYVLSHEKPSGFFSQFMSTHPHTYKRIARLVKLAECA